MKSIFRHINKISLVAILLMPFAMQSCVHEFPKDRPIPESRELALHLDFDMEMPIYKEFELELNGTKAEASYERRYIVRAYPVESKASDYIPYETWVFTRPVSSDADTTVYVTLPTNPYRILVWSDFIVEGSDKDLYYLTDDFSKVSLVDQKNHCGSTDYRDAFNGDVSVDMLTDSVDVPMLRPMAKYTFIATDLEQFVQNEKDRAERESAGDGGSGDITPAFEIDLSNYVVRITYPMYMAFSFNLFLNRPGDAWVGTTFESSITKIDNASAVLGFDYVFVNEHETSVKVQMAVYDRRDNRQLASTPAFDVPLNRGMHTIVTGDFLSVKTGGQPGIDPGFDGDHNVPV